MLDLFDAPVIPGLRSASEIVSAEEEKALIAAIDAQDLTPFQFQQWTGKRLTHNYGWKYDFQSGQLSRSRPMPDWLLDIRDRAAAFAGVESDQIVQSLLIRYDAGAGIGWHKDRPIYQDVMGISLGAPADMRFRKRDGTKWQRATAPLEPRGIYQLAGEVRHDWEHSIVEMERTRWSITFRTFSDKGRALTGAA